MVKGYEPLNRLFLVTAQVVFDLSLGLLMPFGTAVALLFTLPSITKKLRQELPDLTYREIWLTYFKMVLDPFIVHIYYLPLRAYLIARYGAHGLAKFGPDYE